MQFFPIFVGAAGPLTPTIQKFSGRCFDFDIEWLGFNEDQTTFDMQVTAHVDGPYECSDTLWFANTEFDHFKHFHMPGIYPMTIKVKGDNMRTDLAFSGVKVFQFCSGIKAEFLSLWHTLE